MEIPKPQGLKDAGQDFNSSVAAGQLGVLAPAFNPSHCPAPDHSGLNSLQDTRGLLSCFPKLFLTGDFFHWKPTSNTVHFVHSMWLRAEPPRVLALIPLCS